MHRKIELLPENDPEKKIEQSVEFLKPFKTIWLNQNQENGCGSFLWL